MNASIVDQIREQLARQDGVSEENMEPLAQAYALEVDKINDRLTSCVNLLRKGLRSEALQEANMRPNLIERSVQLDFPEIDEWLDILKFLQIKLPRDLNREAIRQLQEAFVEEQPLEELLKQHRRLAIGKAPIAWRLKVLRRISALDPTNLGWMDDVATWERARLKEISAQLEDVNNANDYTGALALHRELAGYTWRIAIPQDLLRAVNATKDRLTQGAQWERMRSVAAALQAAFGQQDQSACRTQRGMWLSMTQQIAPPADAAQLAAPALRWLEQLDAQALQQQSFSQAVEALENAMNREQELGVLKSKYAAAQAFGLEVPFEVDQRYWSMVKKLESQSRTKRLLRVIAMAGAAIVCIAGLTYWQLRLMHFQGVQEATTSLEKFLAEEKLDEAKQFLTSLKTNQPSIARSNAIVAIESDLGGRLQAESERKSQFEQLLIQADNPAPEKIDLSVLLNAEKIAKSEADKLAVAAIRRRRDEFDRSVEQKQFDQLSKDADPITKRIDTLKASDASGINDAEFVTLLANIEDLRQQYPKSGTRGSTLLDGLKSRTTALRTNVRQATLAKQSESNALRTIREAISFQVLEQELKNFTKQFPDSPLSKEFSKAAEERSLWTRVTEWNSFIDSLASYLRERDATKIEELLKQMNDLDVNLQGNPIVAANVGVRSILEKALTREKILDDLNDKIENDWRSGLVTIEGVIKRGEDKQRMFAYYTYIQRLAATLENNNSPALEIVNSPDGTTKRTPFFGPVKLLDVPKKHLELLALELKEQRAQILDNWEEEFLKLTNNTLRHKELDHHVKNFLAATIIRSGVDGSKYLSQRLLDSLTSLEMAVNNAETWFQPAKPQYQLETRLAEKLSTALKATLKDVRQADLPLTKLATNKIPWVGNLQRDGGLKAVLNAAAKENEKAGLLYIVEADKDNPDKARMVLVAKVRDGVVKFNDGKESQLIAGRPLFMLPDSK